MVTVMLLALNGQNFEKVVFFSHVHYSKQFLIYVCVCLHADKHVCTCTRVRCGELAGAEERINTLYLLCDVATWPCVRTFTHIATLNLFITVVLKH